MTIQFKLTENDEELHGILDLQKLNLFGEISQEERTDQGFVTVRHTFEQLRLMHDIAPHVIVLDEQRVIGYILAMTKDSRDLVPVLVPMFKQFERLIFGGKLISAYDYVVIGQVCVNKNYRGLGVFDKMYGLYRSTYLNRFDFAITEIAISNQRSLKAHHRVGFKTIQEFNDSTQEWAIVVLDWKHNDSRSEKDSET